MASPSTPTQLPHDIFNVGSKFVPYIVNVESNAHSATRVLVLAARVVVGRVAARAGFLGFRNTGRCGLGFASRLSSLGFMYIVGLASLTPIKREG
jgi:hypothetical protein